MPLHHKEVQTKSRKHILVLIPVFQIDLKADVGNTKVTGLTPKTEYSLTVYAVYPGLIGESSTVITETSKYYWHQITKSQTVLVVYLAGY